MDTIGPLPPDEDGNCYIVSMIDCFSRVVELVAAKDATARSAAKAIISILRYGMIEEILSDNGPQFIADTIEEMLKYFDIFHRYTLPYRPQANGINERANREIMRHFRSIVFDKKVKNTWSVSLPLVQHICL